MNDLPGEVYIPRRAYPRLRRSIGSAFIQNPSASTPVADRRIADPSPHLPPHPFPVMPVQVTAFSAGNRVRLGIVGVLHEWWAKRMRMSGEIFVSNPAEHRRIAARRMARVRRLDRLVPSSQVSYVPKMYGEE